MLSENIAIALLKIIYQSEKWMASPENDGNFATLEEAISWVQENPGKPIRLCVPVTYDHECAEMLNISENDGVIVLEEHVDMGPHSMTANTPEEFVSVATQLLNDITADCAYDPVPY